MCRGRRWPTCLLHNTLPAVPQSRDPPSPCLRSSGLIVDRRPLRPRVSTSSTLLRLAVNHPGEASEGAGRLMSWKAGMAVVGCFDVSRVATSFRCASQDRRPAARCRTIRDLPLPSRADVGSESFPLPRAAAAYYCSRYSTEHTVWWSLIQRLFWPVPGLAGSQLTQLATACGKSLDRQLAP